MAINLPQFVNKPALPNRSPPTFAPTSVAGGAIASTSSNKKGMRDITLTLDGTTNPQYINAQGDYFMVQKVSAAGTIVYLSFDDGPFVQRVEGDGNRVQYSKIGVYCSAACTITLQVGFGYAVKASASINANVTADFVPAAHNPAVAQVSVGAGLQSKILAANVNGLGAVFKIPSTAANGLWIGDVTAANNVGYYMEPGDSLTIYTTADVYAFNAGAVSVPITSIALTN